MSLIPADHATQGWPGWLRRALLCALALALVAGCLSLLAFAIASWSPPVRPPARNPFGAALPREALPSTTGIGAVLIAWQSSFYRELTATLKAIAQVPAAIWGLLGLSFGYGVFHAAGYIPFIANTIENPKRQGEVLRSMSEHDIAGLIICPARGTRPSDIETMAQLGVPVVLAMRRLAGPRYSSVTPDNLRGARRATEHLLALGHRRIAFFGGYSDMIAQNDRCGGYQAALVAAGIAVDPMLVIEGPPNRECGQNAIGHVLDMAVPPTAALCFNDVVAFGVLTGLERRGLAAGRDFALVGFDDVAEARHTNPPLTTVHVDTGALGERAAHQVLRMIHGDARPEEFVSDVDLVVRASCGAATGRLQ